MIGLLKMPYFWFVLQVQLQEGCLAISLATGGMVAVEVMVVMAVVPHGGVVGGPLEVEEEGGVEGGALVAPEDLVVGDQVVGDQGQLLVSLYIAVDIILFAKYQTTS